MGHLTAMSPGLTPPTILILITKFVISRSPFDSLPPDTFLFYPVGFTPSFGFSIILNMLI